MTARWLALIAIGFVVCHLFGAARSGSAPPRQIVAFWANEGGDKVTKDEQRAQRNLPGVKNTVWDGNKITVFGGRNEVINFNIVLETAAVQASGVQVTISSLTGPNGFRIERSD